MNEGVISSPISQANLSGVRCFFFTQKILQNQFLNKKMIFLHQRSCHEKSFIAQKFPPFSCLQQKHFCAWFNILIVFAKCQEGVQRCTSCTACTRTFKKSSSHKGQSSKCALNYWGVDTGELTPCAGIFRRSL